MSVDLKKAKLVVRHVEDEGTPADAWEHGKRPDNTGFVEIGVEIDGYFHPLQSVKASNFLERLAYAREHKGTAADETEADASE